MPKVVALGFVLYCYIISFSIVNNEKERMLERSSVRMECAIYIEFGAWQ